MIENNYSLEEKFSEESQWWRWPLLPFASIIGATLGSIAFSIIQWISMKFTGGFHEDGWYFMYILPLIQSIVFGWLYVRITCYIAPSGKIIAGTVMTIVLGLLSILGIIIIWSLNKVEMGVTILTTLSFIVGMISSVVTLIHLKNDNSF